MRIMELSVTFGEFDWGGQPGGGGEERGGSRVAGCVGGKVSPW